VKVTTPSPCGIQKRIYLSLEAKSLGYGGIRKISKLSGISGVTITKGMEGLKETDYKACIHH